MVIANSRRLYERACKEAENFSKNQLRNNVQYNQYNKYAVLESYYVEIIEAMFYELVTKRCSDLLSELCSKNGVRIELNNFRINFLKVNGNKEGGYDILPFLEGLDAAFSKNINECPGLYNKHQNDVFHNKRFIENYDHVKWIKEQLNQLDKKMGNLLSGQSLKGNHKEKQMEKKETSRKAKTSEKILRRHDPKMTEELNKLAKKRRENDNVISGQIQQLQISLQEELKQIMSIREGIDYNNSQEAIEQFLLLYSLISETLQYHPNEKNKDSYLNLVESCEDFLENIKQSLAMLGVDIINDVGQVFDPEKHRTVKGIQPIRGARISKVINIGFIYKNKVLEKAEVEIDGI